ncbi:MAG: PAAR domain-containing protein [Pseudomonadota bacterium]
MTMPHAQVSSMHVCPMVTGIVPHVGGPVLPPGAITALVGKLPGAQVSGMATCVGPPDVVAMGSFKTLTGKMPAARLGSMTAHGGSVVMGAFTVLVG